jgi:hypothetical protein
VYQIDDLASLGGRLALEAARIWLGIFGCAAAGWAVGFGMGYRRGVNDAMKDNILKADHRINGG